MEKEIVLEVELPHIRDNLDQAELDHSLCRAMIEAGIPITYTVGPKGLFSVTGVKYGTLRARNTLHGTREIKWYPIIIH